MTRTKNPPCGACGYPKAFDLDALAAKGLRVRVDLDVTKLYFRADLDLAALTHVCARCVLKLCGKT
jgi:hypothetical protein